MTSAKKKLDESQHSGKDHETRRQILKAAEELFLAKGYMGVSMKDVAESVHVTSAALYYHFPNGKQELFLSMIQEMIEEWNRGALQAIASAQGIRESLTLLSQYFFTLPMDRFPTLMRDIFEQNLNRDKKHLLFMQNRDIFLQRITHIFQQAIDTGEVTQEYTAEVLAVMYEGMIISILRSKHLSFGGINKYDAGKLAALTATVLLDGICSNTESLH